MTRAARWAWIVALVAATGGALVLAFLLSIATNNRVLYERHYVWLPCARPPGVRWHCRLRKWSRFLFT